MLGLFEGSFPWFLHVFFGSWKGGTSLSDLPSRASSSTFSDISMLSSVLVPGAAINSFDVSEDIFVCVNRCLIGILPSHQQHKKSRPSPV